MFTNEEDTGSYSEKKDSNGKMLKYRITTDGDNHLLEIDVKSLYDAGYKGSSTDKTKNLASGLVDIMRGVYDTHYTQYASNGSILYVFDERPDQTRSSNDRGQFYSDVYESEYVTSPTDFSFLLTDVEDDDRTMTLTYSYDIENALADYNDNVKVTWNTASDTGKKYRIETGSYGSFKYIAETAIDREPTHVDDILPKSTDNINGSKSKVTAGESEQVTETGFDENGDPIDLRKEKTVTNTWTETNYYTRTYTKEKDLGRRYIKSVAESGDVSYKDLNVLSSTVWTADIAQEVECSQDLVYEKIYDADTGEWGEWTLKSEGEIQREEKERQEPTSNNDEITTYKTREGETDPSEWYIPKIELKSPETGAWADFKDVIDTVKYEPAEEILTNMLSGTTVSFDAKDYTKTTWRDDWKENDNKALKVPFETTIWNENKNGKGKYLCIYHSSSANDYTIIPQFALDTKALRLDGTHCRTEEGALNFINQTGKAQRGISKRRSMYGAIQNRLEHTYNNRYNTMENTMAAESRIRDTDIAKEMVNYAGRSIIEQAGQSVLTQANQSTQGILTLLQG